MSNRFTLIALTNAWLLAWDANFQAGDASLVFGDQEEMGFGARVATALTEKNGGVITSSFGKWIRGSHPMNPPSSSTPARAEAVLSLIGNRPLVPLRFEPQCFRAQFRPVSA
jgi:hypothetical protein